MTQQEKYNGWTNYETWLMHLNLTNTENIYNEVTSIAKQASSQEEAAEYLKEYLDNFFYNEEFQVWKIDDTWTYRDFQEINWYEIATALIGDD